MAPTVLVELAGQKESKKCSLTQVMGKSRKYSKSKGYATTGFVPDFRHAVVETLGDSEGLGSSGRVDTELRVAEPRKNYPSLDVDGCDSFGVPFQLLSVSKMSPSERRNLKRRLNWELEEVRKLQKRAPNVNSNIATAALSSYSDIRSSSEGQKRPLLERQHSSLEASAPHSKKHLPPRPNSSKTKRSNSGRFDESEKPSAAVAVAPSYAALLKQCESLLSRLLSHKFGPVFDKPVDVVKWNIPDYFTIIKHPMDLGTVKSKLISGKYLSPKDFAADVRLTFLNAMTYNPPGNDVHIMADALSKYFETRWKPIEKKIPAVDGVVPSEPTKPTTFVETEFADRIPPLKKKKTTPIDTKVKPIERIMTDEEKQKMSTELEALIAELPDTIIDFLKEQTHNSGQTDDDEIEIDLDALGNDTLFKLRKLLDDYMMEKQKILAATEPCEIKLANESGLSNLSEQQCKGSEPVEEEIDIVGGDDAPLSSYPPVEIENDGPNKDNKCSSSSSSSSESGSSSSDSDSSAESESDIPKASKPLTPSKENLGPELSLDQRNGDLGSSETGIENAVGQVEQSSLTDPVINEPKSNQEGESAPSKRQVSPDKLYRAALLRSRFADTILKAQEKALEKGEKQDPEKLRLEREELEKRKKEEKARLKAEAKVAEEARRKAEAEAAAEAKRKRELEREQARQALQKMEKTVEINESSQFLEDLEMLSSVQDEPLTRFTEESSPDRPQNGLGSFKRQLSINPLEQLGLYMKVDDEDEEEEPPENEAEPTNEVEEGEID